jgi:hypothetical protein
MANDTKKSTSNSKAKSTTRKSKTTNSQKTKRSTKKPSSKDDKTSTKTAKSPSKEVKTVEKKIKPKTKKPSIKPKKEVVIPTESVEMLLTETNHKKLGKVFYLFFTIIFYTIAFFYINISVYGGGDYLQSAIFAFAALFVAFVLMLFNVHKIIFYFFVLPFKRLFRQAKAEVNKEIIYSIGKNKVQTSFNKYKSLFTLILYIAFAILLVTASVMSSITLNKDVLDIIFRASIVLLIYVTVINSWQFLFYIIPSILEKTIDAKNGYVLALSAGVIVLYVLFRIFNITYLSEIMIFILIIGFIALLGVNLNMIAGEINIFQNLRGRKSKAVTRAVFIIFFGFHAYIILYASIIAFSIYSWQNDAFVFNEVHYDITLDDELYFNNEVIHQLYDSQGNPIDILYDRYGNEITVGVDDLGNEISPLYDADGNMVFDFYNASGQQLFNLTDKNGDFVSNPVFDNGKLAVITNIKQIPATYGDFLYWTIISVSTIGYGDIAPSNQYKIAQAWGGFLGLYGLTFFALSISFVANIAMEGIHTTKEELTK